MEKKIYQTPKPSENIEKMAPSIDEQIAYIKDHQDDLHPKYEDFQSNMDMLRAIETTLIAAKHLGNA